VKTIHTGFYSGPGLRLSAVLRIPENYKKGEKRGGIVICGGYASCKELVPLPEVAIALTEAGYVTLNFDYRGFGFSEGPKWRLIPLEQVEDIRNGITFLQTRDEVDQEKIGLWGTSLGGGLVVYAAAMDDRVKCTVSNVPLASGPERQRSKLSESEFKKFLEELDKNRKLRVATGRSTRVDPFIIYEPNPPEEAVEFWKVTRAKHIERREMQLDYEYFEKIMEFTPVDMVRQVSTPIMFTYGAKDKLAPGAKLMFEGANEPKLVKAFDVGHHEIYEAKHLKELIKLHLSWYKKWIPPM